jgi:subtilisin family serine protease
MDMKKSIIWVMIIGMIISLFGMDGTAVANGETEKEKKALPERVIVKLKEPADQTDLEGMEVLANQSNSKKPIVTLEVPEGQDADTYMKELESRKDVEYAEPDELIKLDYTPGDPYYSSQWHHPMIESNWAWNKTKGSKDIVVAVIDNGVDLYHTEFSGRLVSPYDTVNESSYTMTRGDHGTHVAGIIGASMDNGAGIAGVAPNTSIMPIDVFYGEYAYTSDVIEGVYYAVNQGADIINMSLGSYSYNYSFNSAIQYAYQHDVVVIAAAGNDSTSQSHYPSSYPNVISVASTDSYDWKSYFSNYGYDIDIAAPGSSIYSALPYNSYGYMSGTSMASPVVAGAAALILANEPDLSNDEVEQRLYDTADYLGSSYYFGNGRVNAREAVGVDKNIPSPEVSSVYDYSENVTGTVELDGEGYVEVSRDGELIGDGYTDGNGFEVSIPKQQAGTSLSVTVTMDDITSQPAEVTVLDGTAPSIPVVNQVSDQHTSVSGKTEAGAKVEVKAGTQLIGTATASSAGAFSAAVSKQKAGTKIEVTAIDSAKNRSGARVVTVVDKTAPGIPAVNQVSDQDTSLTGKTEPGAAVEVKAGTQLIGTATASSTGAFSASIAKQKAGTKLEVTAIDSAKNRSGARTVTVVDKTAPEIPEVNQVSDQDTSLTGKTEPGAAVEVKAGTQLIGTATASSTGAFSASIAKQKAGTKLEVTAIDSAKNRSGARVVTVVDKTAPGVPAVNRVDDNDSVVSGKAEAGSTVAVRAGKKVLGTSTATSKGTFSVKISKQKAGTKLGVTATDRAKNQSGTRMITVVDKTAPSTPVVNRVDDNDLKVTGKSEAGSKVIVKAGKKTLGTGTATSKGTFSVKISKQKAKTKLSITAADKAKNTSKTKVATVVDKTAPAAPTVKTVYDRDTKVTGKAEAGSTVTVKAGKKKLGSAKANKSGNYSVKIKKQKKGTKLTVTATDSSKNTGKGRSVVVKRK